MNRVKQDTAVFMSNTDSKTRPPIDPAQPVCSSRANGDQSDSAVQGELSNAPSSLTSLDKELTQDPQQLPREILGSIALLRAYPHFRRVWLGAFGSSLGGWMEIVGVQWAMAQATLAIGWIAAGKPSAPIMMGFLAAAQMLPQFVFGLIGGVVADRVNRRTLLLVTQVIRMLIAGVLCVLAWTGEINPYVLLVLGAIDGTAMAFNIPAWQVLTPRLVPRHDLATAIALNGLQFNLARALGPALAGLAIGLDSNWLPGIALVFLVNTLSYIGVIIAVAKTPNVLPTDLSGASLIARSPSAGTEETIAESRNALARAWVLIVEAAVFARRTRGVFALIVGLAAFSALATPLLRFLPILVKEVYLPGANSGAQERAYGILLGLMGVGAVIGALTLKYIPPWYPRHHFVPLSMTLCAVTMCLLVATTNLWAACGMMLFVGLFWLWSFNQSYSALQLLLPDHLRGRVLSISNMTSLGITPFGALAAGYIGTLLAGRDNEGVATIIALALLSLTLLVAGVLMLTFRTPEVDGILPGMPGYERSPGLWRGVLARAHRPREHIGTR